MTDALLFFVAHSGKTFPENFNDVDRYMTYAELEDGHIWRFRDGSALRPVCLLHQRWVRDGRPVEVLLPTKD